MNAQTTQHTPGPWEAKRLDQHHAIVFDAKGMVIASMAGSEHAMERAEFIARAPNLVSEVKQLQAAAAHAERAIEKVRAKRDEALAEVERLQHNESVLRDREKALDQQIVKLETAIKEIRFQVDGMEDVDEDDDGTHQRPNLAMRIAQICEDVLPGQIA